MFAMHPVGSRPVPGWFAILMAILAVTALALAVLLGLLVLNVNLFQAPPIERPITTEMTQRQLDLGHQQDIQGTTSAQLWRAFILEQQADLP